MIKRDEISDKNSCFNKTRIDELVFVVLERDVAAPATIRFWCSERIRLGKNKPDDEQIIKALRDADSMEIPF